MDTPLQWSPSMARPPHKMVGTDSRPSSGTILCMSMLMREQFGLPALAADAIEQRSTPCWRQESAPTGSPKRSTTAVRARKLYPPGSRAIAKKRLASSGSLFSDPIRSRPTSKEGDLVVSSRCAAFPRAMRSATTEVTKHTSRKSEVKRSREDTCVGPGEAGGCGGGFFLFILGRGGMEITRPPAKRRKP